ncbi:hypothetical protein MRB53_036836 [Persea americana]|nr:hypothetical protein MRB53_036836 [Persea americana]
MPPSQLKQLKAQLHERRQGATGRKPNGGGHPQPVSAPSSKTKAPSSLSNRSTSKRPVKSSLTAAERAEDLRKRTLLPALYNRNRTGGIVDRRIGEGDMRLKPEERLAQRFARAVGKRKRNAAFDLEDGDSGSADEALLTHGGVRLGLEGGEVGEELRDDFEMDNSDRESDDDLLKVAKPRSRLEGADGDAEEGPEQEEGEPPRKKSKKEVMEEVIAKSKMYKAARQQAKDVDDEERQKLDKQLPDLLALLAGGPSRQPLPVPKDDAPVHPERAAMLGGQPKADVDKQYDKELKALTLEKRAKPTERTKTEEEKATEEARRLQDLEAQRLRRMQGELDSEDEIQQEAGIDGDDDIVPDEAADFGLQTQGLEPRVLDVEEEDDFVIDDDLVNQGSDADIDDDDLEIGSGDDEHEQPDDDEDFLKDVVEDFTGANNVPLGNGNFDEASKSNIAFTYPCPQSHAELVQVLKKVPPADMPTVIQRIRALYHAQLSEGNKQKLANFSIALVEHLPHLATPDIPLSTTENVIRHVHSLSKSYPEQTARAFRHLLGLMHKNKDINAGDIVTLTAISTIYPTSDHFHQVVTPAITIMARYLGLTNPSTPATSIIGAYLVALVIKYQRLSKRYMPEAVRFTLFALKVDPPSPGLDGHCANIIAMADLWAALSAFVPIFTPLLDALTAHKSPSAAAAARHLRVALAQARLRLRPLELHHHRPLPIRTSIPRFEDSFNPNKHYDPDKERTEQRKLKAEYKREKKGAIRELRKDAAFLATTKLREKRERDAAYEKKQRRLIAEIQGTEGREANEYEREKRRRKEGKRAR